MGDSLLPLFVPPCPRKTPPRTPTGCALCDQQAVALWERDNFKFPLYHYLWQNGLTKAKTWRCPDADERERLLGFRPDHSRPALGTSAKCWELEAARLRPSGTAVHTNVFSYLFYVFFHSHQVPMAQQPVWSRGAALGSFGAPSALPRSTLRPSWWKMEKSSRQFVKTSRRAHQRVGTSSSHQWGPLAFTVCNKHSKGVQVMDSMVI